MQQHAMHEGMRLVLVLASFFAIELLRGVEVWNKNPLLIRAAIVAPHSAYVGANPRRLRQARKR